MMVSNLNNTIHVVGLGMSSDDLSPGIGRVIDTAEVLAGSPHHLAWFPEHPAARLPLGADLDRWLNQLVQSAEEKRVVVVATGDPNYYGIARRIIDLVGAENVRVYPNVSVLQAAYARLKESWAGVAVVSLHGRSDEALFSAVRANERVAVYTDPVRNPAWIAQALLDRGQMGWRMCVLEDLGTPEVRVTFHRLTDAASRVFSRHNFVTLWKKDETAPLTLGTPDDEFVHENGMITKAEVRAVALAKLGLGPDMTLWDLGAGCGSVGIEATLLMPGGRVVSVERQPDRARQIAANRTRFGVANLEIVTAQMPDILVALPNPDRIFIGGGGAALPDILRIGANRLPVGGIIVAAVVQLDSLEEVRTTFWALDIDQETTQVQINRETPVGHGVYLKALNPVWLVRGRKSK